MWVLGWKEESKERGLPVFVTMVGLGHAPRQAFRVELSACWNTCTQLIYTHTKNVLTRPQRAVTGK